MGVLHVPAACARARPLPAVPAVLLLPAVRRTPNHLPPLQPLLADSDEEQGEAGAGPGREGKQEDAGREGPQRRRRPDKEGRKEGKGKRDSKDKGDTKGEEQSQGGQQSREEQGEGLPPPEGGEQPTGRDWLLGQLLL